MSNKMTAEYGRTRDGMLAARVGNQAFAMMPTDNAHRLAKAWGLSGTIEDWTAADFYGGGHRPVDEAGFRESVEQWASHQRQLVALGRSSTLALRSTPWGQSQHAVVYGAGIVFHHTASHGGFELTADRNTGIHRLQSDNGFYEEDCAWAAVAAAFPKLFTDLERRDADEILKQVYPDAWETIHGATLERGQRPSILRCGKRRTLDRHFGDPSAESPGFVECIATLGGRRGGKSIGGKSGELVERRFLVAEDRYDIGEFGYVIDEEQDQPYDGPSSFVGSSPQ
ncbi:DUF7007 domain-containing protein [Rhizobium phaseoli]|uniref:DUF7007 domain-containing protein n=1 Tax=Rhizobium phaseoli TaxID=396 RepID=UPI001FDFA6F6|nr:hypothetical protein [Rhizobium phaseoli]